MVHTDSACQGRWQLGCNTVELCVLTTPHWHAGFLHSLCPSPTYNTNTVRLLDALSYIQNQNSEKKAWYNYLQRFFVLSEQMEEQK